MCDVNGITQRVWIKASCKPFKSLSPHFRYLCLQKCFHIYFPSNPLNVIAFEKLRGMICFNDQIWKCLVSYSDCKFKISILPVKGEISLTTHKSTNLCKCPLVNVSVMCLVDLNYCYIICKSPLWFKSTAFLYLSASCWQGKPALFWSFFPSPCYLSSVPSSPTS